MAKRKESTIKAMNERAAMLADYILEHQATVRTVANIFGYSKTLVWLDVTTRLAKFDTDKAKQVASVLHHNLSQRHLRGGESTRKRFAASYNKRMQAEIDSAGYSIKPVDYRSDGYEF